MVMTTMPGMATEVSPLFAGRCGPLWHVECTGLGLPLAARALPTALRVVVSPAVSNPLPTCSVHRTLAGRPSCHRGDGQPLGVSPRHPLPLAIPIATDRCGRPWRHHGSRAPEPTRQEALTTTPHRRDQMDMGTTLLVSVLFSALGAGYVMYGKQQRQVVPPWCPRRAVNNQQPPTAAPCEPQRRWRSDPGSHAS